MIAILKRRSEFLRVRGGSRWATPRFVLEAKPRPDMGEAGEARFGFTVSKQVGNAVVRNRVRRRLREAVIKVAPGGSNAIYDYVLIARTPALACGFTELTDDLIAAFARVHRPPKPKSRGAAS